jgi:hypothetical protein
MRPISRDVNDLMDSYDASFSIKQPRINWNKTENYTVGIVEKYKSIPQGGESSVQYYFVIEGCYASEDVNTGEVSISRSGV